MECMQGHSIQPFCVCAGTNPAGKGGGAYQEL